MKYKNYNDKRSLLLEISKLDFAIVDMTLYLDTHPYDQDAMEQWNHYQCMKRQLEQEYNSKYPPIRLNSIDGVQKEWKWALQDAPWVRGY